MERKSQLKTEKAVENNSLKPVKNVKICKKQLVYGIVFSQGSLTILSILKRQMSDAEIASLKVSPRSDTM